MSKKKKAETTVQPGVRVEHDVMPIEYNEVIFDDEYYVLLKCGECGNELNKSKKLLGKEVHDIWTSLVMSSGFNAGNCKNGCRSTFSDLNINTKLEIIKA